MSEQTLLLPPDGPTERATEPAKPKQRDVVPWLYGLGFVILGLAIFYLWQFPGTRVEEPPAEAAAIQAMQQHLADIDSRLTRLEQRPVADLGNLTARLDAIDGRMADQTKLASRLDTLSGRIESLSGRDQTGIDAAKQQIDALTARVTATEGSNGKLEALAKRLIKVTRLEAASLALAAGRPIGDMPNAPAALSRYAHEAPPTIGQLRLRFGQAEQAALAAKQPTDTSTSLVDRAWDRAQGLITIRRGDAVVVGNTSSVVLGRAREALDAGDLGEAVAQVDRLEGPPAQVMAGWLTEAKALLDARAAIAGMADQA